MRAATAGKSDGGIDGTKRAGRIALALVLAMFAGAVANLTAEPSNAQAQQALGSWVSTGEMGEKRVRHAAVLLDGPACRSASSPAYCGKVLVAGGADETQAENWTRTSELYDPVTGTWTPTGSLSRPFRAGDVTGPGSVEGNLTATLLDGPECRAAPSSAPAHCGKVLLSGWAFDELGFDIPHAEIYDPVTGRWSVTGAPSEIRSGHGAVVLDGPRCGNKCGRVLVAGGHDRRDSAEIYDPVSGSWAPAPTMKAPRDFVVGTVLDGPACTGQTKPAYCGTVLVAHGARSLHPQEDFSAELYNPSINGVWEFTSPTNGNRHFHTATLLDGPACRPGPGMAAADHCGRVLVTGRGLTGSFGIDFRNTEVYDPDTPTVGIKGEWIVSGSLNADHHLHTATLLDASVCHKPTAPTYCGMVLVAGGTDRDNKISDVAELYDPASTTTVNGREVSGKSVVTAPMTTPRWGHSATLLDGPACRSSAPPGYCGAVLVAGGGQPPGQREILPSLKTAELFLPPDDSSDLSLSLSDGPDPVDVGEELTYTAVVANAGPSAAQDVVVTDVLPASVTYRSSSVSQGTCTVSGDGMTVSCSVGQLASGASATVTIVVTPTQSGDIVNAASTSSSRRDANVSNNGATAVTTVTGQGGQGSADLGLAMTDSPDPVGVGDDLTYRVTVSNQGPATAQGVAVTDALPASVTYKSSSPSGSCTASSDRKRVTCNLGSIAAGASATTTIVVITDQVGTVVNSASVTSSSADPNGANNSASTTTTVAAQASPSPSPTVSPDPAASPSPTDSASPDPSSSQAALVETTLAASATRVRFKAPFTLSGAVGSQGSCAGPYHVQVSKRVFGRDGLRVIADGIAVEDDGSWSLRHRSKRSATYVSEASSASACERQTSATVSVVVKAKIRLSSAGCTRGGLIEGEVKPNHTGTKVKLHRKTKRGWKRLDADRLDRDSRFVLVANRCKGKLRVVWPAQDVDNSRAKRVFRP